MCLVIVKPAIVLAAPLAQSRQSPTPLSANTPSTPLSIAYLIKQSATNTYNNKQNSKLYSLLNLNAQQMQLWQMNGGSSSSHSSHSNGSSGSGAGSGSLGNATRRLRKRHSKRHSNWADELNFNENTTAVEWSNPCGGCFIPINTTAGAGGRRLRRKNPKQVYNILKKSAGNEYKTLNESHNVIKIRDIDVWQLGYGWQYKFLPKLKMNSSIALKRWYRKMQTYVGAFAYLRRAQLKWDRAKQQVESDKARELKHLLSSSRRMLCELETAVNNTHPYQKNVEQITRPKMNKRLKLRTKTNAKKSGVQEADHYDLKFVKHYYYEFLRTMFKLLRQITKRPGQSTLRSERKEFNEISKFSSQMSSSGNNRRKRKQRRF